ncbi:acetoacetate--CoA ligase [Geodermatophilus sp. YIM 151500]|uniref:acetoacetate--CoA ligase n=1 Tax=Geodermatophilus sp. YIM 151500 TaxID=2984531 RepID=UPI0021E4E9B9|nr:acetoacetate--CoA ligase [Geodermatophilus sp. YIM 151500]MCV2489691.1 acetoacetate--CoA ligase [Geodermatophilus sp. YIM 151500]
MTRPSTAADGATATRRMPQIAEFRQLCEQRAGHSLTSPAELHGWSVEHYQDFWRLFLDWSGLAWEGAATPVCVGEGMERAAFFPRVRLNYAENLLRPLPGVDDDAPALTSVHGSGDVERLTRAELRAAVSATAGAIHGCGVGVGDRVAVIAPNSARTVVTALALAALGVPMASATPDMGPTALVGRLEQVEPVLLVVDRTGMRGAGAGPDDALARLLDELPTVRQVLVLDDGPLPEDPPVPAERLGRLVDRTTADGGPSWPRLPFDHPLWVMFSSGTTGPPKAMVHGAGGSLVEHVKEHRLHGDLRADDVLYFHTTTAWMMWNWQLSALAVGAQVVLYDGPVAGAATLWQLVADHGVTVFGTSPAYLQLCQDVGYRPAAKHDLGRLRAILSTGAVLHDWQFDWVAREVGPLPLQSISGGTDIVGCFVLGHPERPVERGRCQSLGLGLDVAAVDAGGVPVLDEVGDLVCRRPFPSRPVCFLRDPSGRRFHDSYFAEHAGVWTHGDRIEIDRHGGSRMHGRADGVLNVDGVRIGPAEIYRILRGMPEIDDAMAVEQRTADGSRLLLLAVLRPGHAYDDDLATRIRARLRAEGSAAHVPQVIAVVDELPLTHNGKRSERAARDVVNGDPVRNLAALRNPAALEGIAAAVRAATTDPAGEGAPDEDAAAPAPDEDALTRAVSVAFREVLGRRSLPPTANFFDLGGTSRQCMTILRRLRLELRRPVPLATFLAAPSIAGLVEALRGPAGPSSRFVQLRAGDPGRTPLFVVHGVYGDADAYRSMAEHLGVDVPVHGIEASLMHDDGRAKTVAEIAAEHVAELQRFVPTGRLSLAGYSFGGLVALEMARQLAAVGRQPAHLVLLDVRPPRASLTPAQLRLRRLSSTVAMLLPAFRDYTVRQALSDRVRRRGPSSDRKALRGGVHVFHDYRWGRYEGPVTYCRARTRVPVIMNQLFAWRTVLPRMTVVDVPGAHDDLMAGKHAPTLAAQVTAALTGSADRPAGVRTRPRATG